MFNFINNLPILYLKMIKKQKKTGFLRSFYTRLRSKSYGVAQVGRARFELAKANANRFTVCPR